jgi:hypothetical protein
MWNTDISMVKLKKMCQSTVRPYSKIWSDTPLNLCWYSLGLSSRTGWSFWSSQSWQLLGACALPKRSLGGLRDRPIYGQKIRCRSAMTSFGKSASKSPCDRVDIERERGNNRWHCKIPEVPSHGQGHLRAPLVALLWHEACLQICQRVSSSRFRMRDVRLQYLALGRTRPCEKRIRINQSAALRKL